MVTSTPSRRVHPLKPRVDPNLTTRQLAETIGASDSSVKRWIDRGEIIAFRTGGGHRRVPLAEAIRFIRRTRSAIVRPEALGLERQPLIGSADTTAAELFFDALHRDDPDQAERLVIGRFIAGSTIAHIGDQMIQPALARIGELWEHDSAGVLYEHRAIDTCVRVTLQLEGWLPAPAGGAPLAITAAGPDDQYLLPPLLASLALRERGIRARNLGPQTPVETLALAVEHYRAAACALSFSVAPGDVAPWATLLDILEQTGAALLFGGRAAGTLPPRLARSGRHCATLCELHDWATAYTNALASASEASADKDPS